MNVPGKWGRFFDNRPNRHRVLSRSDGEPFYLTHKGGQAKNKRQEVLIRGTIARAAAQSEAAGNGVSGGLLVPFGEGDGIRTRNHRIDSPVL